MEIGVRVEAQPWNDPSQQALHVASAYFVFVAIDADGRSREVPGLLRDGSRRVVTGCDPCDW